MYPGICMNQLEAHTASRKFLIRIAASGLFRIEYGKCSRYLLSRKMMVADNYIETLCFCIPNLFNRFDPAVKGDDQLAFIFDSKINTLYRNSVTLLIPVRTFSFFLIAVDRRSTAIFISFIIKGS